MENSVYPPACGRAQEIAPPGHPAAIAATRYTLSATLAATDCEPDSDMAGLLTSEAAAISAARGATQSAPVRIVGWEELDPVRGPLRDLRSETGAPEPNRRSSTDRAASDRGFGQDRTQGSGLLDLPTLERRRNRDANGETVHFALEHCLHVPRRSAPACAENSATTIPIVIPLTAYP